MTGYDDRSSRLERASPLRGKEVRKPLHGEARCEGHATLREKSLIPA